ncbi:MAG: hypothetical protein ACPGYT_08680 [Nitrospirales bacterium]
MMNRFQSFLLSVSMSILFYSSPVLAVEIQQGTVYPADTLLESSLSGVSLTVPSGWQGSWPTGSTYVVLGSEEAQAYIFIHVNELDDEDIDEFFSADLPLEDGLTLHLERREKQQESLHRGEYSVHGSQRPMIGHVTVRKGPHEIGAAFIAISAPETAQAVKHVVYEVAKNMTFTPPTPKTAATPTTKGTAATWQEYLNGRYVLRLYSGSGYHEEEHVWLCRDGSFFRSASSGGFGGGASAAFDSHGQGTWKATGHTTEIGTLILSFAPGEVFEGGTSFGDWKEHSQGGEVVTLNVALQQGGLYLNGTRWFRKENQRCP